MKGSSFHYNVWSHFSIAPDVLKGGLSDSFSRDEFPFSRYCGEGAVASSLQWEKASENKTTTHSVWISLLSVYLFFSFFLKLQTVEIDWQFKWERSLLTGGWFTEFLGGLKKQAPGSSYRNMPQVTPQNRPDEEIFTDSATLLSIKVDHHHSYSHQHQSYTRNHWLAVSTTSLSSLSQKWKRTEVLFPQLSSVLKYYMCWDFPGGPMVRNPPYNAGDVSSIPGQVTRTLLESVSGSVVSDSFRPHGL